VVALNRAVAVSKLRGARAGFEVIEGLALPGYYLLPAVRAELYLQLGQRERAAEQYREALGCGCSAPERRFLERRLSSV
jgi:RNA polymerase sigma-70 factor (ECF subfamily)